MHRQDALIENESSSSFQKLTLHLKLGQYYHLVLEESVLLMGPFYFSSFSFLLYS